MKQYTIRLAEDHVQYLLQHQPNLTAAVRHLIDLGRAEEWVVEINSLIDLPSHRNCRVPFDKRWMAEQWAWEQFNILRDTQGSIYVSALVDGRDVMLYEISLNAKGP